MIPPSVTESERLARTASTVLWSRFGSGKFCTLVATYVAIEMPPAVTYSTKWYVLPTGVYGLVVRTSVTESMIFVVVEPTQKKVATIASPRCGFVGLNPLMSILPVSLKLPFHWSRATPAGGGAFTLNAALVAPVKPAVVVAPSVYPLPALSMLRVEKAATPLVAVTVFVPESVPPPGFMASATVIGPLKLASVLRASAFAVTWTAGEIAPPAVVALGCTVNTRCVATGGWPAAAYVWPGF